jgi:hypothetical protein
MSGAYGAAIRVSMATHSLCFFLNIAQINQVEFVVHDRILCV